MSNATNAIAYLITETALLVQEDPSEENKNRLATLKEMASDPKFLESLEQDLQSKQA